MIETHTNLIGNFGNDKISVSFYFNDIYFFNCYWC